MDRKLFRVGVPLPPLGMGGQETAVGIAKATARMSKSAVSSHAGRNCDRRAARRKAEEDAAMFCLSDRRECLLLDGGIVDLVPRLHDRQPAIGISRPVEAVGVGSIWFHFLADEELNAELGVVPHRLLV